MRVTVLPPRGEAPNSRGPWGWLCDGLRTSGHEASIGRSPVEAPEALVAINDQREAHTISARFAIPVERRVLIALEPAVSLPRMYRPPVFQKYGHRFAASPMWAHDLSAEEFPWPHTITPHAQEEQEGTFLATMINAEKRSAVSTSLYSLRRRVIKTCDAMSLSLAVFGPGWRDSGVQRCESAMRAVARALESRRRPALSEAFGELTLTPRNCMGVAGSKSSAFAYARTTIVIENSPDYVSEKLLDAIANGVAPIYVGPPLPLFAIPTELAISCPPSAPSVASTLENLPRGLVDEVIAAGREWVRGSAPSRFDGRTVLMSLGQRLGMALNRT